MQRGGHLLVTLADKPLPPPATVRVLSARQLPCNSGARSGRNVVENVPPADRILWFLPFLGPNLMLSDNCVVYGVGYNWGSLLVLREKG